MDFLTLGHLYINLAYRLFKKYCSSYWYFMHLFLIYHHYQSFCQTWAFSIILEWFFFFFYCQALNISNLFKFLSIQFDLEIHFFLKWNFSHAHSSWASFCSWSQGSCPQTDISILYLSIVVNLIFLFLFSLISKFNRLSL